MKEYYIVDFVLSNRHFYTIWYSSDVQDGFILNTDGSKVRTFATISHAELFLKKEKLTLQKERTVFLCDEINCSGKNIDCNAVLPFWNIISDMANSLNISFLGLQKEESIECLYDKLFHGCNLPSYKGSNPDYFPTWSCAEIKALEKVIDQGKIILHDCIELDVI